MEYLLCLFLILLPESRWKKAFFHLDSGNKIKNKQSKYSIERMDKELQAQIDVCDESFFESHGNGGYETEDPIFILGLPRAGSTLIEQILAKICSIKVEPALGSPKIKIGSSVS